MVRYSVGHVVLVNFPFSNLKGQKRRPALVIGKGEFGDLILCQITSRAYSSTIAVSLHLSDFNQGGLPIQSYIRPDKIFTADPRIIVRSVGQLKSTKLQQVHQSICRLLNI